MRDNNKLSYWYYQISFDGTVELWLKIIRMGIRTSNHIEELCSRHISLPISGLNDCHSVKCIYGRVYAAYVSAAMSIV